MAGGKVEQFSFADALVTRRAGPDRLGRLSGLVKWYRFEKLLKRMRSESETGRPAYPVLVMFKALLLQRLYGLSDMELEEALYDRFSFRRFSGLSLEDPVPDHTTLCRFRNRLVESGLLEKLFVELDRQLDAAGLIIRRGTMLDATVIETEAAARPPGARAAQAGEEADDDDDDHNGDGDGDEREAGESGLVRKRAAARPPRDPDAAFTRRKGRQGSSYGYKAHVGVDEGSGLIRRVITTPANVNDTVPADGLVSWDEGRVLADSAYHTHARAAALRQAGIGCGLMRRPNKHHPKLKPAAKRYNRYVGLAKATGQVILTAMAFNMRSWVTLAA